MQFWDVCYPLEVTLLCVCMYVYIYIYIYVYTSICIHIYIPFHPGGLGIHYARYTWSRCRLWWRIYTCVSVYMYVCIYIYTYMYIYIYIYIYTQSRIALSDPPCRVCSCACFAAIVLLVLILADWLRVLVIICSPSRLVQLTGSQWRIIVLRSIFRLESLNLEFGSNKFLNRGGGLS